MKVEEEQLRESNWTQTRDCGLVIHSLLHILAATHQLVASTMQAIFWLGASQTASQCMKIAEEVEDLHVAMGESH